jgi:hypothetical protein
MADGLLEASEHAGPSILAEHRPSNEPVQFGGAGRRRSLFRRLRRRFLLNRKNCRVYDIHHKLHFFFRAPLCFLSKRSERSLTAARGFHGDSKGTRMRERPS